MNFLPVIRDRDADMAPFPVRAKEPTVPATGRKDRRSGRRFVDDEVGIGSLVGYEDLFDSVGSDVTRALAEKPTTGLSPLIPKRTGSGVWGTQTTQLFAMSTVSQVWGNVYGSAKNRLSRLTYLGVP